MNAPPAAEPRRAEQEAARPANEASTTTTTVDTARTSAAPARSSATVRAAAVAGRDAVDFSGADGTVLAIAVAHGITLERGPQGGCWRVTRAEGNKIARTLVERGVDLQISAPPARIGVE